MQLCRRLCYKIYELYRRIILKRFNVLFIGTEQSGKTMLVSSVFEGKFERPPSQQKSKVKKYIARNVEFYVYDVPGGKEDLGKWDFFYKKSDVVVFVFDSCSSEQVCEQAKVELFSLLYRNMWEKRNLLVLGSKNDMPNAMDCKDIILALGLVKIYDREVACYSVSAKNRNNVDLVISWLVDQATQNG